MSVRGGAGAHHWLSDWFLPSESLVWKRYMSSLPNSNCMSRVYVSRYGAISLETVVTLGP